MTKRDYIPLNIKLAAALLQLRDDAGHPLIPYADAKLMTADQIISLFHLDHWPIRHTDGGPSEPWNLQWRFIAEHRVKTATVDAPQIAKDRRIARKQEEFRRVLLKPCGHKRRPSGLWPTHKFNQRRKMK